MKHNRHSILIIKTIVDIIVAFVLLIVLCPIILLTSLLLIINNRGSVFFYQERPGKDEKIFKVIKFKTMNDKKDNNGNLLPDAARLTKVGSIVRKLSLDELPQLINVLKGDMSLVGPRPLLPQYLPLYNEEQKKRHNVRPGITGWAQVNGRNNISWTEKFELDVWYVNNYSFKLDLKICFMTIMKVIKKEDIALEGEVTTVLFNGEN